MDTFMLKNAGIYEVTFIWWQKLYTSLIQVGYKLSVEKFSIGA